jgi:hypothetical protein
VCAKKYFTAQQKRPFIATIFFKTKSRWSLAMHGFSGFMPNIVCQSQVILARNLQVCNSKMKIEGRIQMRLKLSPPSQIWAATGDRELPPPAWGNSPCPDRPLERGLRRAIAKMKYNNPNKLFQRHYLPLAGR